jgi:2-dehydro-3-deoxyphosphogluconate aldolase/(4S)-4-hydroxy-2-oxoglutarate aldolase
VAQFTRLEVLNTIVDTGLVPVFYNGDLDTAVGVVRACAQGGAKVVEFTNRGDFAYEVFAGLVKHCRQEHPGIILGVGSVGDPATAALYIANGANFIVGPITNPEVAKLCNRRKIAYAPGCGSATEIANAEELGCEIVKLFPGLEVGGPSFVKSVLAPSPWTRIMPTGGVEATQMSISAWIEAGVAAVGVGGTLITKRAMETGDFDGIASLVGRCLAWIREARGVRLFLGCEHPGIYPDAPGGAEAVARFYADTFGFDPVEGPGSYFVTGAKGQGRIEVLKDPKFPKAHIAIRVSDFEAAVASLRAMGVELEEPDVKPTYKAVYLKNPDPAGHRVHLLWNPGV